MVARPQRYVNYRDVAMEDPEGLLMGDSAAAGAAPDPQSAEYQQWVLDQLARQADFASRGRLLPGQREEYEQVQGAAQARARGAQGAMQQRLAARGGGGADTDMLVAQMGGQQQTQARAVADAQMQAQLADRARSLQSAYSQLAQGMRGQAFDESYQTGQQADRATWFDTDYQRDVEGRNTERRHEQSSADAAARQQDWENDARRYTGSAGERAAGVRRNFNSEMQDQARMANAWGEVASVAGSVIGAAGGGSGGGGFGGGGGGGSGGSGGSRYGAAWASLEGEDDEEDW